jgi:hypothetical protein
VDDAGFVKGAIGLPHPLESPVGRMVVRARHEVEANRAEIFRNRRRADYPDAPELRLRNRRRPREIDRRAFEVAERDVGVVHQLADRRETGRLRDRPRDDAVADGGEREAVGDARRELPLRIARRGPAGRLPREHERARERDEEEEGQQSSHVTSTCARAQTRDTLDLAPAAVKRRRLSDQ